MSLDDELVQAFLEESVENLDQLDLDLVALENSPSDPDLLGRIFRTIHTIKGTCGFLEYGNLEALAHAGEDLLGDLRDGTFVLDEQITTALLRLVDRIREVLAVVETTGTEGDFDHSEVIADLVWQRQRPQSPAGAEGATTPAQKLAEPTPAAAHEETSVRIDVTVLDQLQDLVGELTLARIQVGEYLPEDGDLGHAFHRLTATTRELQDTVMQARLQPVSTVTDRLRRIVRDVATHQGKQVHLQIEGGEVAVDKAVNEILRDPLVHLVRNAVDHGIETPAQRQAAGKPAEAELRIEAAVVGGGFQIDVIDDGRGIDTDRLVAAAIAAGQLTTEAAAELSEGQRLALVFRPGVSTATEVTTVSGRGVGMDVVRANLEQVGGSVEVASDIGVGTTFRISMPLTLAILPAIVVTCGNHRFTIPQADVEAIVRVPEVELGTAVDTVGGSKFVRYRDTLLPLVDLADYLGVDSDDSTPGLEIVVVNHLDRSYGLAVDTVGDSVEAVVKPLPRALHGLSVYAGVTVLSDGRPTLILETSAPAVELGLTAHQQTPAGTEPGMDPDLQPMLTVVVADNRLAVPLDRVIRLLSAAAGDLEHSGHDEVVQHQGAILPVIRLAPLLDLEASGSASGELTIVACESRMGTVGLIVDELIDIEWANPELAEPLDDPCLVGRLIVSGKVTELVSVDAVAERGLQLRRVQSGEHG